MMLMGYENIIFMKYGVHASEKAEQIVERKMREIQETKRMFWGYGGTICHPINQVQPFLKRNAARNQKTYLVMAYTPSKMDGPMVEAISYSTDKVSWNKMPTGIHVYGSKYAIVCSDIRRCDFTLDLADYMVPVGRSKGRLLSEYVNGRVDKGCGTFCGKRKEESRLVNITLCAEIAAPYAVFLK